MEALRASTAFSPIFQTIIAAMVAAIKPWGSSGLALFAANAGGQQAAIAANSCFAKIR
jgi:hypothetical protein